MYDAGTGCARASIYRDVMTAIVPDNCSAFATSMWVYDAGTGCARASMLLQTSVPALTNTLAETSIMSALFC